MVSRKCILYFIYLYIYILLFVCNKLLNWIELNINTSFNVISIQWVLFVMTEDEEFNHYYYVLMHRIKSREGKIIRHNFTSLSPWHLFPWYGDLQSHVMDSSSSTQPPRSMQYTGWSLHCTERTTKQVITRVDLQWFLRCIALWRLRKQHSKRLLLEEYDLIMGKS